MCTLALRLKLQFIIATKSDVYVYWTYRQRMMNLRNAFEMEWMLMDEKRAVVGR